MMKLNVLLGISICLTLSSCNRVSSAFNPFYDSPPNEAYLGERSDRPLSGGAQKIDSARSALQAMGSYKAAQAPEPVNPVIQPAVVRLMWVPDHLNSTGDLIPAHYYYLRVLKDRWAVTDAFELESQLGTGNRDSSNVPYILQSEVK
jgi:hypothetical protein